MTKIIIHMGKTETIRREKGITLIALIITIIVLIILSSVTIKMIFDSNIITMALKAKEETEKAQINEEQIMNETGEIVNSAVGTNGTNSTEPLEKTINIKSVEWDNGKATVVVYCKEIGDYQIEWQINGTEEGAWTSGEKGVNEATITGVTYQDRINVRLNNGIETKDFEILTIDDIKPKEAIIKFNKLSPTSTIIGPAVKVTVSQKDNESGIDISKSKWIYNTNEKAIGTNEDSYTGIFSSDEETISMNINTDGRYYVHVLSVDNVGNKIETISEPIDVRQTVNLYNLNDTCDEITGGWGTDLSSNNTYNVSDGTLAFNGTMYIEANTPWAAIWVTPKNFLDYSSYSTYGYTCDVHAPNDASRVNRLIIMLGYYVDTSAQNTLKAHNSVSNNLTYEVSIKDIKLSDNHKIGFAVQNLSTALTVYKVWLK